MSKKKKDQKEKWLKDLRSPIEEVVLDAVDAIAKKGDIGLVRPLLDTLQQNSSERVASLIQSTLADVKDERLGDELYVALNDNSLREVRKNILSVIWNAGVPVTGRLEQLVNYSIEGDFQEQFEVLTILENTSSELEEEEILNSLISMREYIQLNTGSTEVHQEILQKLQVLERFD